MKMMSVGQIFYGVGNGEIAKKGEPFVLDDLVRMPLRYPYICIVQKTQLENSHCKNPTTNL
jgi:hypothetical protein